MRIRSIKPEFWRSRHVAKLPWDLRLLFVGLWSYVDDNGVGIDDPWQIAADVFPLDPDPAEVRERVSGGLARLSRVLREGSTIPFIVRYEVGGKRYLYITGWSHQRIDKPSRPRYPVPPEGALTSADAVDEGDTRETLASPPEKPPTGTGEQGNRGTKRSSRKTGDYTPEFEQWWLSYPQRNGSKGSKFEASKAWAKSLALTNADALMASTKRYSVSAQVRDGFAKDAATWLNKRCWEDHPNAESPADVTAWINAEWQAGRVREIERHTGLLYRQPDLPGHLAGKAAIEQWLLEQAKRWIADNRELITERLAARRTA